MRHISRAAIVFTGLLAACQPQPVHWKDVTQLDGGGTMEIHFVVLDAQFARDRQTYEDAAESVCSADICQVGFFATRNDVPNETMRADFFANGGWQDRHETALFFRNTNSGLKTLQFDCNAFPQSDLDSCLAPVEPDSNELRAAQARGPLKGFGKAKFGMTTNQLVAALGGPDAVHILNPTDSRTVIRTKSIYHGRTYNAFYNVMSSGFSTVLMTWSDIINNDACVGEAKKIAGDVASDFGKETDFSYFDKGGKTFRYKWLFADGATVELNNISMKDDDCTLSLSFNTKQASN